MAKKAVYYLGRVLKLGVLTQETLINAILSPVSIKNRGCAWTITDSSEATHAGKKFFFGKLSKYAPHGEVEIVDEVTRSEKRQIEPNLLVASSFFIYIPNHSGICFHVVSGQIETHVFAKRFSEVIEATHGGFFVDCEIELISDLKSFAIKLGALSRIFRLEAKISPPNPLFSPLWAPLEKYLRERNTDRMTVVEDAPSSEAIKTNLPELVQRVSEQTENQQFTPESPVPIGDAAILMAADGYGRGTIKGQKNQETVVIKTSETTVNFTFDKSPDPKELYIKALEFFERIEKQRHMEHGQ